MYASVPRKFFRSKYLTYLAHYCRQLTITRFRNCVYRTISKVEKRPERLARQRLVLRPLSLSHQLVYSDSLQPPLSQRPHFLVDLARIITTRLQARALRPPRRSDSGNPLRVHRLSLRLGEVYSAGVLSVSNSRNSHPSRPIRLAALVNLSNLSSSNNNSPSSKLAVCSAVAHLERNLNSQSLSVDSVDPLRLLSNLMAHVLIGTTNTTNTFGTAGSTFGQPNTQQPAATGTGLFGQPQQQPQQTTNTFGVFGRYCQVFE